MTTDPSPRTRVLMVHHTHWDREWWTTFQQFRYRLVHVVDRLLDALDADPAFGPFTLDGQTIALKDYLEVRPAERERLLGHVRAGRIAVGPWHVLPDEFLVSGEATVRNLWLGELTARSLGVRNSTVGYLPDQFGHAGQIPQVLRGFGLGSAVVWRGFGAPPPGAQSPDGDVGAGVYAFPRARDARFPQEMQSEFWWEAPDGSRVLGVYLPLEYYRGHYRLDPDDAAFTEDQTVSRARRTIEYLRAYATGSTILEPMGGDHLPVDPRLPGVLAELNRRLETDGVEYRLGTLEDLVHELRDTAAERRIVWKGEGRAFGRRAHLLPGVLSARLYLKRLNRDAQVALERYAEPLQALAWTLGSRHERDFLWFAWERLVQNHPHDSICGCSHDQVHREMLPRFAEAQQVADLLADAALEDLAARVDTSFAGDGPALVVWNPLSWARTDVASVILNPHLAVEPRSWVLRDPAGREVPFQARTVEAGLGQYGRWPWLGAAGSDREPEAVNDATEVRFVARDLPALGHRAYALERRAVPRPSRVLDHTIAGNVARDKGALETTGLRVGPGLLENEHLRVTVSPEDGTLTLTDLASGHEYPGLGLFRDGGDAGDTYNYAEPVGDQVLDTRSVRPSWEWMDVGPAVATLRLTWRWALPARLSGDRRSRSAETVPFVLHVDVTLAAGARRVDLRVHLENTARDHRLQALFPLGTPIEVSSAEGVFEVVDRPVRLPEDQRGSAEPAVPEHPQARFVSVSDGRRSLTVANRGLPEFAVLDDGRGTIALTILRSVGWLSREDLLSRVGGAGPTTRTPEAQMLGPWVAEYSLIPHAGRWADAASHRLALEFDAPPRATATQPQAWPIRLPSPAHEATPVPAVEPVLPAEGSLVAVEGNLVLSALKRAEDRDSLVLRFLNQGTTPGRAVLRPSRRPASARLVNLREEPLLDGELAVGPDGSVELEAGPWQLVTIELELPREGNA